jgi:hypothetical protein
LFRVLKFRVSAVHAVLYARFDSRQLHRERAAAMRPFSN